MNLCPLCNEPYARTSTHSDGEQSFTHESNPKTADFKVHGKEVTYTELSFCHTSNKYRGLIKGIK